MKTVRVVNLTCEAILVDRARVANTWAARLRGLLGRPVLAWGEGLVITPCRAVHTFGMTYPIDVVYVARDGRVVLVHEGMPPGRRGPWVRAAAWVLELPAGAARTMGVSVGDRLVLVPTGNWSVLGSPINRSG